MNRVNNGIRNVFSKKAVCTSIVLLSLLPFSAGFSTTWHVEQDGSGDFVAIQPAVDASAEGDTILIGPGNYTEAQSVHHSGWSQPTDVFVNVTVENLTFIGTSADEVFIGPDVFYQTYFGPQGFSGNELEDWWRVENVTIRNVREGMYVKGQIEAKGCRFVDLQNTGIVTFSSVGASINQCDFQSCGSNGFISYNSTGVSYINNCSFFDSRIYLTDGENVVISGCQMGGGGAVGIQVYRSPCSLIDTKISDFTNYGIYGEYADLTMTGCIIENNNKGIRCLGSTIRADSTIFENNTFSAISPASSTNVVVRNSHLLAIDGWLVHNESTWGDPVTLDFTNNWWGTTDPDLIAAQIWDSQDDPEVVVTVNYLPMAGGQVSVETMTFDGLKALFR